MIKKLYLTIALSIFYNIFSQGNPASLRNLPDMIPPSPTVNNLMKFEEVPVSNYTGVPDISIPIVSLATGLKDVGINIGLQYHIYNAKPEDKASEVGLGWSLSAGGTISRTVMGSPDEKIVSYNLGSGVKIGIYLDETTNVHAYKNYFHTIIDDPALATQTVNTNKAIFEAHYKNRFDTQYDLYQYNFLNYTGRFVVKKIGNQLKAVKLDKNNLKIQVIYNQSTYEPTAFKIIDDKGNIYIFNVVETSNLGTFSSSQDFESTSYTSSTSSAVSFNSAFHLSKIQNSNGQDFALFKYADPVSIVSSENTGFANLFSNPSSTSIAVQINKSSLPRKTESNTSLVITGIRKLTEIELPNQGKVGFEYELGREDTNYIGAQNSSQLAKLKTIWVLNNDSKYDHQYNLNYVYREGSYKKLFLASVEKTFKNNSAYQLEYKYTLDYYPGGGIADEWGFYDCKPAAVACGITQNSACGSDLLKSITYPTKGKAEFHYETNTFTYAPQVLDFDNNELNWNNICKNIDFTQFGTEKKYGFTILRNGTNVNVLNNTGEINSYPWQVRVFRKEGSNYIDVGGSGTAFLPPGATPPAEFQLLGLAPGDYYFELTKQTVVNNPSFNASFYATYREKNFNNYQYLFGGGIRIKNISYYNQGAVPERTVNYDYMDINDPKKSSGGLVFPIPVMNYSETYKALLEYPVNLSQIATEMFQTDIIRSSTRNFIQDQKTKGGEVGYQYVTVSETNKGKTIYKYTSPADHPLSIAPPVSPPFFAVPNNDFERGNLLNKKVYDNNNQPLTEDDFQYAFESFTENTGGSIRTLQHHDVGEYLYGGKYNDYEGFVADYKGARAYLTPDVTGFLTYYTNIEMFGTAHLVQQKSTTYFPNMSSNVITTDYVYNPRDYLLKKTITYLDNSKQETSYKYAHEKGNQLMIDRNMISLPMEIETTKTIGSTTKMLDKAEIVYPVNQAETEPQWGFVVPLSAKSYDLENNNTPYTEITYNQYDNRGNLQQYTTKDGIPTTIIWGYNQTQPIAKVVGATLRDIPQPLFTAIVDASNLDASNPSTETALITALDNFRKDSSMAGYQITTYTYDPLIGVTSITPPSGIREVYIYDTANRLMEIRESSSTGKLLKEFKYNYKN
ncbi:hypothetical protein QF023_000646 [Chryseobacterium sp. SLBN-27]|uniref:hypothetical protein n=1 Tax=Chryseobacterium sp. SLBN-27 TaxID=3042287 RepID=UPI00285D67D7|nr:hypothetical protein [Chryseobacterium sp. SLBN-27]MDR6157130.1 hypothetical protein [Chryseobacterium sp. SLBN-27]